MNISSGSNTRRGPDPDPASDATGSVKIRLQKLMQHVCKQGFEHHVVMTQSKSVQILEEAFGNYFGWEVHHHQPARD